jgi:hypothetical protein
LATLGPVPIPIPPIFPPSEPPPAPPPGPPPPPPGPTQDPDGFPDVGNALFVDRGKGPPASVWGSVDCAARERVTRDRRHGNPFRRLSVLDGDDFYGERCELGRNNHLEGPTALYRDGERLVTYVSLKLSKRFPMRGDVYQVVTQMKQTQPSASGGGRPALALQAYGGRWVLVDEGEEIWSAPARRARWTRFSFDIFYSDSPADGTIRVAVDLNGDGDAHDEYERSSRLELATLKTEGPDDGRDDGVPEGGAIPSHLRVGIYHDESYDCHGRVCSLAVDDVGIFEPR